MHPTKAKLIVNNGLRCMYCGRTLAYREINWHHIVPKFVFKQRKEPIDNSYENGALLCLNCHAYVHTFEYWSSDYRRAMDVIRRNKK